MSEARYHPLEAILRMCAHAAPQAWHYRMYAKETGTDPEQLVAVLEMLWLEGLVQKASGSPEAGPGVTVTELGRQVADDPDALRRLCAGEPIRSGDVGSIVRQSLRKRTRPLMTQLIVAANLIMFAIGAWFAAKRPGLLSEYLAGFMNPAGQGRVFALLHQLGSLSAADLIRGEWWRLISMTFLHDGVLHLAMNMYTLYVAGSFVEQTWGRWRYLAIYLISGWGGSCLAMAYGQGGVGASGAICGVLAAEGMWVLLYGRHLPQRLARSGRTQMITTLVLIVFISLMPMVSWQGHLGGGLAGAAAALVLHFQRFGPAVLRVLGVVALLAIPWGSYAWMERGRATNKGWLAAEESDFEKNQLPVISRTTREAFKVLHEQVDPLLERHASRRDEAESKAAIEALEHTISQLKTVGKGLQRVGPYRDKVVETARTTALGYVKSLVAACEESVRCLRAGKDWKKEDEKALLDLWKKAREDRAAWEALLTQ